MLSNLSLSQIARNPSESVRPSEIEQAAEMLKEIMNQD